MPQFHETVMGHRFFEGQLPKLISTQEQIAESLKVLAALATDSIVNRDGGMVTALESKTKVSVPDVVSAAFDSLPEDFTDREHDHAEAMIQRVGIKGILCDGPEYTEILRHFLVSQKVDPNLYCIRDEWVYLFAPTWRD